MRYKSTVAMTIKAAQAARESISRGDFLTQDTGKVFQCLGIVNILEELLQEYTYRDTDIPGCILERISKEILEVTLFITNAHRRKVCTIESTESCQKQDSTQNSSNETQK